jgi:Uncharacterized conserved protein
MRISEIIRRMKKYHKGEVNGIAIDEAKTRDKVLYGNPEQECTGIVTSCWASVDVIRKAQELGANLIIVHEALFWNHGDHIDWLLEQENKTFLDKKKLLDDTGIVVWRDHDYVHSGIPVNGTYVDGIFYGVMKEIGWEKYLVDDISRPMMFEIPEQTVAEVGKELQKKFGLSGIKVIGDLNTKVKRVSFMMHIMGNGDNDAITHVEKNDIDLLLCLELIDFTLSEYIRDSSMLGYSKAILAMGHFNIEEPGMAYMVHYIPEAIGEEIPCTFVKSGDMYCFI